MRIIAVLALTAAAIASANAVEQMGSPGYRGDGTGVSPSALTPLPKPKKLWESQEQIPITWITSVGCIGGYGSVAFANGRAFLSYYEPTGDFVQEDKLRRMQGKNVDKKHALTDASDVLLCLDVRTGKTLWKFVDEKARGYNPAALGGEMYVTPCIAGKRVFNYGTLGWVYCHDVKTGEVIWETWLPKAKEAKGLIDAWKADENRFENLREKWKKGKIRVMSMKSHHNAARGRSPVYIDGVLVAHDYDNGLVGLDAATGQIKWERDGVLWGPYGSTPIPFGEGKVLAGTKVGITCLDVTTGKTEWKIEDKTAVLGFGFGVAVSDKYIAAKGGHKRGKINCWSVESGKPVKLWELESGQLATAGVMILDGYVWAAVGGLRDKAVLTAFDLKTGEKTGSIETGMDRTGYAHLSSSDGLIAINNYEKWLQLFVADPANPRPHGERLPAAHIAITPVIGDGLLFTRTSNRIVCWQVAR